MSAGRNFILNNYKTEHLLHSSKYSRTELVMKNGIPYIRKIINAIGLPYAKLKEITHPCLPHIFFSVEDEHKTYIIEEYISGISLKEALERGFHFSFEQQKNIAKALCTALVFLHEKGILHRDIKPSNIIVMHDFQQVKLIDFGIARNLKDNKNICSQDTCIMGTPGYAPPEQYGFSTTDQRSDIYSLGKTLLDITNEESDPNYIKILKRCTEFDPNKRYNDATELLNELSREKKSYILPLACLSALIICLGSYYLFNTASKSIPDNISSQPTKATADTVKTIPPQDNSQQINSNIKFQQNTYTSNVTDNAPHNNPLQHPQPDARPKPNTTKPDIADPLPQSILQQKVYLTKLKQVGYDWWFSKDTLKTIDDKDNIYTFKGLNNKGPIVTMENISDYPAINPLLKLELYSFGMKSENFEWKTDDAHIEKLIFSRKDRFGIARRVTIQLTGIISPHSKYTFSGIQNVKDFYMYYKGDHGTILGQIECQNMVSQNVGYQFNLK